MEAVNELDEPYTIKPCVSGKLGYSPKTMVVIVSLCEYWNAGYHRAHSSVKGNRSLPEKLGLDTAPSKTTIGNAYQKIPESYFHKLNEIIT